MGWALLGRFRAIGIAAAVVTSVVATTGVASADDSLADRSSAELTALLPDDAVPPDWHVSTQEEHGKSIGDSKSCLKPFSYADSRVRPMASLVAKPSGGTRSFMVMVIYGKESEGYDAVGDFRSWVEGCQDGKELDWPGIAVVDSPEAAPDPSATARLSGADGRMLGFVTVTRVRGLVVDVVAAGAVDARPEDVRDRFDQALQATVTKLRQAP